MARESDNRSAVVFVRPTVMSGLQDRPVGPRPSRARRGGVRTSVLSLLTIAALVTVVIVVLARSLNPPEQHRPKGRRFAVKRIVSPRFPLAYRIGAEDVIMAGSSVEGEVRISARLAQAGSAGPPRSGDLKGERPVPIRVGARNADVAISRIR